MKKQSKSQVILLALVGTLLFFASGCRQRPRDQADEDKPAMVETRQAEAKPVEKRPSFVGTIQAYEEARIGAAQSARIERILVDVGDTVSLGQLLVVMDRTQLHQAQVQYQTVKKDLDRLSSLHRAGAVTQQSYDQLKAQYDIAKTNMENLTHLTEVRATIPGVISGRYNSPGEVFFMTQGTAGKPAIVSIMQIQPVKITINLPEKFFPQIRRGLKVTVASELFPDRTFMGRVDRIYPIIERATATFRVQVVVDNDALLLRPGMFVRATVTME